MKILIYANSVGRGGVTRVVEILSAAFARAGLDCAILGQRYNETGHEVQWERSFPFVQVRPVEKLPLHPLQFNFLLASAQVMVDHLAEMQHDFDVIFAVTPWWSIGGMVDWEITTPVVSEVPDFAFDHINMGSFLTPYMREAARRIAERSSMTIFLSDFQRKWGEDHYGYNRSKVIHHAIDYAPFVKGDGELPPGVPDEFILAFHCWGHKDPETILRGYGLLRDERPVPPLVMAGIGTEQLIVPNPDRQGNYLRGVIKRLGLEIGRNVIVPGFVKDEAIPALYKHALASIIASRSDGDLSLTIYETINYRTPLVYDDLEVFTESLRDGEHGISFMVGSGTDLSRALGQVLDDPAGAKQRAERAYADFSVRRIDDVVKEYVAAFEQAVEHKTKCPSVLPTE